MTGTVAALHPALRVTDLSVSYLTRGTRIDAVRGVSFDVEAGQTIAIVGESGSGKTTTGQAIIGLLAKNARVESGKVELEGTDILGAPAATLGDVRGSRIALIPQDPTVSLNPLRRVGVQIAEVFRLHGTVPKEQWKPRTIELLERVGFTDARKQVSAYPHELSGGQRQRVLIAIAIANSPSVIIADEPTSGLDVTVQRRTLDLLDELQRELGTAIVHVTHDLAVASDRSDTIAVLRHGQVVEFGRTAAVIAAPRSDYARHLLSSAPSLQVSDRVPRSDPAHPAEIVLEVSGLAKEFPGHVGSPSFLAVNDVSFSVPRGSTLSIVGESGSGKSTTARLLTRLIQPTSGRITLLGRDYTEKSERQFRHRRVAIQVVYQNPFASLDPKLTVGQIIEEPLKALSELKRTQRLASVSDILDAVALPQDFLKRPPRELSGGQRQRVAIARALVLRPDVVVLDEPISALDASVQGQILDLLESLQQDFGSSYVFISHDLAVVRRISDHVVVLNKGRVVEQGPAEAIFTRPQSDYTRDLLAAVPGGGKRAAAAAG
ncbi:dipeptide ABC transporter ATP-binding protein [Arthrobacter sp. H-02-3]|uniref:dipeptide ABC transporter ATP-binding protein n=1 Tax=Arthrobacter sp. H-02-3 TaxID=2703675 RepID=UPI000DD194A8|nr:ABC transporter ATP-binding protein [Arthrobacter sp. H-02-3]PVZ53840.1 ABC transporter ATP-binding protein [Arthrobacter sp. H-02-3]